MSKISPFKHPNDIAGKNFHVCHPLQTESISKGASWLYHTFKNLTGFLKEGGDWGSLWYRYQRIRYQVPLKLNVLVPPILGERAIMNMTNSEGRSTSVPYETNEQDQATPEHVTVASVSLSTL